MLTKSNFQNSQGKSQILDESGFKCNDTCQINFDGKFMKDLPGHKQIGCNLDPRNRTLSISKTDDSTGEGEAQRIVEILEEWSMNDQVIDMGFGTTSSNT